ncbi:50S ribosomal protein L3 [archaeon]|nr:MAG: 50S ribosomal protein L3 [archaeon]RLG66155.1 MAG: 50S ribosomal protein L3 [archaeon]
MGRKYHAPKRGSLRYLPRKRARSIVARIRYWPKVESEKPMLLGFAGYKAGMIHLMVNIKRENRVQENIFVPATVVETPPLLIVGVRLYKWTPDGWVTASEIWANNLPEDIKRRIKTKRGNSKNEIKEWYEKAKKLIEENPELIKVRVIACTQPRKAGIKKKKPEVFEIEVGGGKSSLERFEYAFSLLGKEVSIREVFSENQFIDVASVTKGKGFQGPVKRWGVRILQHKSRKTKRGVGAIGPWKPPNVMYTVPRPGQLGFHQRTEYNKLVLKIGSDGSEITPKSGFKNYGIVRSEYMILKGSIPCPTKRLVKLRWPARPKPIREKYEIVYVSSKPEMLEVASK